MQLRKEPAPIYTLKADGGPQQRGLMRYQIEAAIGEHKAAGYGETKKAAKVNSATNLLKTLGIDLAELREAYGVQEIPSRDEGAELLNLAVDVLKQAELSQHGRKPTTSKIVVKKSDLNQQFKSSKQKLEFIARKQNLQVLYNEFIKG